MLRPQSRFSAVVHQGYQALRYFTPAHFLTIALALIRYPPHLLSPPPDLFPSPGFCLCCSLCQTHSSPDLHKVTLSPHADSAQCFPRRSCWSCHPSSPTALRLSNFFSHRNDVVHTVGTKPIVFEWMHARETPGNEYTYLLGLGSGRGIWSDQVNEEQDIPSRGNIQTKTERCGRTWHIYGSGDNSVIRLMHTHERVVGC